MAAGSRWAAARSQSGAVGKPALSIGKTPKAAPAPATRALISTLDFPTGGAPYRQFTEACFVERIGTGGLARAALAGTLGAMGPALARLKAQDRAGLPILRLAETRADLGLIERESARLCAAFDEIAILGTGGSSLGGQTLAALADHGFGPAKGRPRLHFLDNIDAARFEALFAGPSFAPKGLPRTGFVAISKSGATPETCLQFMVAFDRLRATLGEVEAARRFTLITEPGDNPMRAFAERFGIPVLDHDPKVGGRYSALSLVGLLPAHLAGVDIAAVREGAASVLQALRGAETPEEFAPALGAALAVALQRECRIATTVLMPYVDRLAPFGMWFRQLWAESLGKDGKGTTPARALGTVDQHSQLQLYLAGPPDKMFTLVVAAQEGKGRRVPADLARDPRLAYLAARTMGDLLAAEQRATYDTLAASGRPVRVLAVDEVDPRSLGALLMHFMIETILAADLLGVDPFDQPAVEDGKRRARAYLAGTER